LKSHYLEPIWTISGSIPLPQTESSEDAFAKLDPLFRQVGTTYHCDRETLTFEKKNQAAQDKMSIFDRGTLHIAQGADGLILRYNLFSRALLFCFLAPLLFLGIALVTLGLANLKTDSKEAVGKASASSSSPKKTEPEKAPLPLNAIDKFLGAPEPEKPDPKKDKKEDDKPSPTSAYVFAALFATLYVIGRILEERLVKSLFRRTLHLS
jgi:hypothetical protein